MGSELATGNPEQAIDAKADAFNRAAQAIGPLSADDRARVLAALSALFGATPSNEEESPELRRRRKDRERKARVRTLSADNSADMSAEVSTEVSAEIPRNVPRKSLPPSHTLPSSLEGKVNDLEDFSSGSPSLTQPKSETARAREVRPAEQEYQRAYERGIAKGKGSPFAMPEGQRGELHQAMLAHSAGRRGERLLAWIEGEAEDFATWLAKKDTKTVEYYSGFGPRGWLRFMNTTPIEPAKPAPHSGARSPPNGASPSPLGGALGKFIGGSQ
jgi:hypothetical protein